ncbi:UTP--glucose-1-phosphate uridylyltransferase [Candidatus Berkelbacteria bacterium RBG_13_40_8]|uniref:UTP--glucose-1-phosphate uridylyltransferase n=1 Tax=Candidatus Berkelbacteria bacterium RBG_13_40_8 TaxID=1797467 RepID=A0A1F5DLX8_9BACT|nr:MAG: UTP--glucose-1-phosphate uridylyltransferase [Candidatus Berkelbacteria bacterium RBG_13_40_8]
MTKASPKEMLPVIDKPVIQYVVEEAIDSGIEDIIIVTGYNKRAIEDHFDHSIELENYLEKAGKLGQLEEIRKIAGMANFIYIRQKGHYGNGTPILNSEAIIGDEPFAVLWGDQFTTAEPPRLSQMIKVFEKYHDPVLSFVPAKSDEDYNRYGVPEVKTIEDGIHEISDIIEKPGKDKAPSNLVSDGGYILTPDIFQALKETEVGKGNELWLVDGINKLKKNHKLYACEVRGKYYDTGNKLEYLKANVEFALQRDDIQKDFKEYLRSLNL